MAAFKHILLPTDGSTLSTRAAKAAIALARSEKARITAIHVIAPYTPPVYMDGLMPDPELFSPAAYKRATEAESARLLDKIKQAAAKAKVRCETLAVSHARPWEGILRTAKSRGCDLIVMASHGRRGLEAVLLGSETQKVLTHSKLPVMVCR